MSSFPTGKSRDESAAASTVAEQERPPNFREDGKLYLVRCFNCNRERGTENHAFAVASGACAWCGWSEAHHAA